MNIERSIKYVFDDEEWLKKLLIGAVVNLVPIVNFATMGYALEAAKNAIDGQDTPLPDWANFGEQFVKGLLAFLASLIYYVPLILVACVAGAIGGLVVDSSGGSAAWSLVNVCFSLVAFIYGLAAGIWLPAALTRFVVTGEFGSMFQFSEIWSYITSNLSNYVLAVIATIVISIVAGLVGSLACGIGVLFTSFWAALAYAHLFAQVYVKSTGAAEVGTIV